MAPSSRSFELPASFAPTEVTEADTSNSATPTKFEVSTTMNDDERIPKPSPSLSRPGSDEDRRKSTQIARLGCMLESDVYHIMHIDSGESFKAIERLTRQKVLLMKRLRIEEHLSLMRDHSKNMLKPWLLGLLECSSVSVREVLFLWVFVAVKLLCVECHRLHRLSTLASVSFPDIDGVAIVRATSVDKTVMFHRHFQLDWASVASFACESVVLQRVILTFVEVHMLHRWFVSTPHSELRITCQGRTLRFASTNQDRIVRVDRFADYRERERFETTLVDLNMLKADAFRSRGEADRPYTPRTTLADLHRILVQGTTAFIGDTVRRRIGAVYCVLSEKDTEYARSLRSVEWVSFDRSTTEVAVLAIEG
eukprot:gene1058-1605_t